VQVFFDSDSCFPTIPSCSESACTSGSGLNNSAASSTYGSAPNSASLSYGTNTVITYAGRVITESVSNGSVSSANVQMVSVQNSQAMAWGLSSKQAIYNSGRNTPTNPRIFLRCWIKICRINQTKHVFY